MGDEIDAFIAARMEAAQERLEDWLQSHPEATPQEGAEELFAILMGKRDQ